MNANLSLHFLPLDTTPHTVVPTTGHGRELEESRGRTGEQDAQFELIFKLMQLKHGSSCWLSFSFGY